MNVELGGIPQERTEGKQESPFCIYIAGAGGTNKGQGGIDASLKSVYGVDNVATYNSAFSSDKPSKQKYHRISETIEQQIAQGNSVDLVVHSMGAGEGWKALKDLKKRNPDFFEGTENLKKLNIKIVAAPGFFKGLLGAGRTLRSLGILGKESVQQETALHAIDSVNAFPPTSISPDELYKGIRSAFADKSNYDAGITSIRGEAYNDYSEKLTIDERTAVEKLDGQLSGALKTNDTASIRKLLLQRGKVLLPHINNVYAGEYFYPQREVRDDPKDKWTIGAFIGLTSLLSDMFRGVPRKKFKQLEKKGVKVDFIIPEYDMMMPLSNVVDFFNGDERKTQSHTTVMEGHAHSTLALQADPLAKAVTRT